MLNNIANDVENIYIALGSTNFRKQIDSLSALVSLKFNLDPFTPKCLFIFCNKSRNSIKVLKWDTDGFILLTKPLIEKMKFQWPKYSEGVKDISARELRWLLEGLSIDQPKVHKNIIVNEDVCF